MTGEHTDGQERAEVQAAPGGAQAAPGEAHAAPTGAQSAPDGAHAPDLPVAVEPLPGSEPLSPERERELARAAVVAALVALRHVEAMHADTPEPHASRFAAPARAHRRTPAGSWRHRF